MNSKQELESIALAARVIGLEVWKGQGHQETMAFRSPNSPDPDGKVTGVEWNPLKNKADTLELLVKSRVSINYDPVGSLLIGTPRGAHPALTAVFIGDFRHHKFEEDFAQTLVTLLANFQRGRFNS